MKLTEIEIKYRDYLETQHHQTPNKEDKEQVWSRVLDRTQSKKWKNPIWYLAAASIALLLLSSFVFYQLNQRDRTIHQLQANLEALERLQAELVNNNMQLKGELKTLLSLPPQVDTVVITKVVQRVSNHPKEIEQIISEHEIPEELPIIPDQEMPELANLQRDVESLEIEYGEKTGEGITPWRFTVTYH